MDILLQQGTVLDLEMILPSYVDLFPEQERKTTSVLKKLLGTRDYILYKIVNEQNSAYMGFVLLLQLDDSSAIWLDFIGIDKTYQGYGIGSKVLNLLKKKYSMGYKGMYFEVECLDENPDTARRIKFYEKFGAKALKVDYNLPTQQGDLPMLLYYQPLSNEQLPSQKEVDEVIRKAHQFIHFDLL
ncbi:GNAT family N-acetyltransferase [Petrocella sp. FN5]|uniref:GNAT family N-acetyltransferase n=1 Tax=Petrocella sp. FN5 TaxID=3032002 RepID=UPI0023D9EB54|nr:GNAT family N-acetyltransferase [Petrocella sp. FN5]MDF1617627.1 GNAT family N-acetyltransferase [Petrocella sp. FN5]